MSFHSTHSYSKKLNLSGAGLQSSSFLRPPSSASSRSTQPFSQSSAKLSSSFKFKSSFLGQPQYKQRGYIIGSLFDLSSSDSDDYAENSGYGSSLPTSAYRTRFIEIPSISPSSSRRSPLATELDKISKQLQRTREELNGARRKLGVAPQYTSSRLTNYEETDEVLELIKPKVEEGEVSKTLTKVASLVSFGVPSMCTSPKGEENRREINVNSDVFLEVSYAGALSIKGRPILRPSDPKQICTCMAKAGLRAHNKDCTPTSGSTTSSAAKRRPGVVDSVILIQKAYRKYLKKKDSYSYTKTSQSPLLTPSLTPEVSVKNEEFVTRVPYRNHSIATFQKQLPKIERQVKRNLTMTPSGNSRLSEATKVFMSRKLKK